MLRKKDEVPSCFDSREQFKLWVAAARSQHPTPGHEWCEDCTKSYQDKMIWEGRCAYPGTIFIKMSDGAVEGRRPFSIVKKLRQEAMSEAQNP
jgi:hypothetical protein